MSDDSTNEWLTLDQKVLFHSFLHYLTVCLLGFNSLFCLHFVFMFAPCVCDTLNFCCVLLLQYFLCY